MKRTAEEAAETREKLLEVGLHIFAQRGYTATTLAEIAIEAGVTRGAVYHHFSDKADLFITAVAERWSRVGEDVWRHLAAEGPPREQVRRFVGAFYTSMGSDPTFRELLGVTVGSTENVPELERGMQVKRDAMREWIDQLTEVFVRAEQAGQLRPGMSPRMAANWVVINVTGVVVFWSLELEDLVNQPRDVDALSEAVVAGVFR